MILRLFTLLFLLLIAFNSYSTDLDKLRAQASVNVKSKKYESAEKLYSQVLRQDTNKADVIAYLQLLLRNKKYEQAKIFCEQDYIRTAKDAYLKMFIDNVKHVERFRKFDYDLLKISELEFNTNHNESILGFYANGFLVNKSSISSQFLSKKLYATNLDVDFNKLSKFKFRDINNRKIITANYHSAMKTLFYDCIIHKNKNQANKSLPTNTKGIVFARLSNYYNQWVEYKDFPFNSNTYNVIHPSMSKDGKRLYFASDMPGGYGGYDIYYSEFKNYVWSIPENLGPFVNTPYDEVYPFIYEDSILYFSTEGRAGLGGLDIFEYRITSKQNAINIGAPFNSNADDFGIKKHPKLNYGFFNSNRNNDNRFDVNVYRYNQYKLAPKFIPVYVKDSLSKVVISDVKLNVYSNRTKELSTYLLINGFTNELKFDIYEYYQLTANIKGYKDISSTLRIEKNQSQINLYFNSDLDKINNSGKPILASQSLKAIGLITDYLNKKPLSGVKVRLVDIRDNSLVDTFTTDSSGKYSLSNLLPNNVYTLNCVRPGYERLSIYITTLPIDKIIQNPYLSNVINNFSLTEIWNEKDVIKFNSIRQDKIVNTVNSDVQESKKITKVYYKRNSVELDNLSKVKLNEFLQILKDYPDSKLVILSHTDAFGDAEYNRLLSLKRANETAQYFVDNGINIKRIFAWGKGETQPLFMCDENNKCSEKQIQANRRTEIKIIFRK